MQKKILKYYKLKEERTNLESLWDDCYKHTLPFSNVFSNPSNSESLYDSTASDCADLLASHLLSEMTPPYSSWFQLSIKNNYNEETRDKIQTILIGASEKIYNSLNASNFFSCIHQCYIDLIIMGTACLLFEEAPLGQNSAFSFKALPMKDVYADDANTVYRRSYLNIQTLKEKFPTYKISPDLLSKLKQNPDLLITIVECTYPSNSKYEYVAFTESDNQILATGEFAQSPFIVFRYSQNPTGFYGRSPIMKALPDIKTANKIVELVLKNASLAVSGVWQVDDDGVLNPANIELTPGAIIPKAVGSSGLTPLKIGSDFNISDIVLQDVRDNIKSALLYNQLQPLNQNLNMSATEVMQRTQMSLKILGATYGRLQTELLTPLIMRAFSILCRRGEINLPELKKDINITYVSKLGQLKSYDDIANIQNWIKIVSSLGLNYENQIDKDEILEKITEKMNISKDLLLTKDRDYEKKIMDFVYKMPAQLIEALITMSDSELDENLKSYATWLKKHHGK